MALVQMHTKYNRQLDKYHYSSSWCLLQNNEHISCGLSSWCSHLGICMIDMVCRLMYMSYVNEEGNKGSV